MEPDTGARSQMQPFIIGAVALILIAGGGGYYYWSMQPPPIDPAEEQALQAAEARILANISSSAEASTLKDTIPTVTTVANNPVEAMYHNPFE